MTNKTKENRLTRRINVNNNQINNFVNNSIKTAKYNLLNFVPLAILVQMKNYFNIFFLFNAVILSIKEVSPMDPVSAILPFLFVISIGMAREAIEDNVS